jgi:hypothetical protein
MKTNRLRTFFLLSGLNLLLLVIVVVAVELTFGQWFADYFPPYGAIFDRHFTYKQSIYEPYGTVNYRRDQYGLRGVHGPINAVKVVTIGGSTTDQRFITDGETWQDVFHALTGIPVANAGVDGLSSSGHVVAVVDWLHRIPNLNPRFYLHYLGVNDALYVDLLAKNVPSDNSKLLSLLERQIQTRTLSRTLRARSALVRSYLRLTAWLIGPPTLMSSRWSAETAVPEFKAQVNRDLIRDYIDRIYKPNLRRLIALHRQNGEQAVFVSQPAHPGMVKRVGDELFLRTPHLEYWAVALALINDATERVCGEYANACSFVDLARRLQFDSEDFYDFIHATPAGARRIGTFLAEQLLRHGKLGGHNAARE